MQCHLKIDTEGLDSHCMDCTKVVLYYLLANTRCFIALVWLSNAHHLAKLKVEFWNSLAVWSTDDHNIFQWMFLHHVWLILMVPSVGETTYVCKRKCRLYKQICHSLCTECWPWEASMLVARTDILCMICESLRCINMLILCMWILLVGCEFGLLMWTYY
jgi:hypothetical protein